MKFQILSVSWSLPLLLSAVSAAGCASTVTPPAPLARAIFSVPPPDILPIGAMVREPTTEFGATYQEVEFQIAHVPRYFDNVQIKQLSLRLLVDVSGTWKNYSEELAVDEGKLKALEDHLNGYGPFPNHVLPVKFKLLSTPSDHSLAVHWVCSYNPVELEPVKRFIGIRP